MAYLFGTPDRCYIYGSCCEALVCNGAPLISHMGVLHRYLSIGYDDVISNFYHFIAVLIGKTGSMSFVRFNNRVFYILLYFVADFKQVFTIF